MSDWLSKLSVSSFGFCCCGALPGALVAAGFGAHNRTPVPAITITTNTTTSAIVRVLSSPPEEELVAACCAAGVGHCLAVDA